MSGDLIALWVNGEIVDSAAPSISALDHGFTVGDGVFETLKMIDGTPFALSRHMVRLHHSCDLLGIALPLDDLAVASAIAETRDALAAAGGVPGRVRVTVTSGAGAVGTGRTGASPTVVVSVSELAPWDDRTDVITVPWRRNEHSPTVGAKTISYAENVVVMAAAHAVGATEALMANTAGVLCEGAGSNVFLGIGGRLVTPSLATGCLAGVTRNLLLELVDCEESETLSLDDLRSANEAFLTSTTREVQPIATVDGAALPSSPGPLTTAAAAAFADLIARTLDP